METKKIAINLNEVEVKDLNGQLFKIEDLAKNTANKIFMAASTIEVSDIARTLHKGETANVTEQELEEILTIVQLAAYYKPWVQTQITEYLSKKYQQIKKQEETKNGKDKH
ncbi:hypothetical protein FW774_17355 [Pedobacter sp. BS3]|uniref:hypothetical protein n=1 Tax=Pedobacter sp. BS3 TaxID=2567937 RepID=UPI0011EDC0F7|nr:hypothetical protein [Pedobacter sp. BS3]TZF81823.1 hypothetical protein FW774_17355 [Pedobacter sp. BS3]